MNAMSHMLNPESLEDEKGWFTARCTCRWSFGPLPDVETLIDVLMEHALYAGANLATGRPVDTGPASAGGATVVVD